MKDIIGLNDGFNTLLVNVHTKDQCAGQPCCIHNPSDHHMATWTPSWDDGTGTMWRRCPHNNRHPDPDDLNYQRMRNLADARIRFAHFCDGCCQLPAPERQQIEAPEPEWRNVEHEPVWSQTRLRYNAAGDTKPGWICIHELENGMGQCGGNVFRIEDAIGKHSCIVHKGQGEPGNG